MNLKPAETAQEKVFQAKLKRSVAASHLDRLELQKPTPLEDDAVSIYGFEDTEPGETIPALGMGTLRKEYPLEMMEFERRPLRPSDVAIDIHYCGVCHSDWHVIRDEWKNTKYPIIVGHEIVGKVIGVGSAVTKYSVGDLVAVGPNVDSCRTCNSCKTGFEQYCENDVTEAYNMPERQPQEIKPTGPITQGGYSNLIIVKEHFVLSIPFEVTNGMDLARIAPLLCAGITMYTPLKYIKLKLTARVGIAGLGGLGHLGVKIAKSMGFEVIVLTTTPEKLDAGAALGADKVLLATDITLMDAYRETFDLIICTIPFNHDINMYIDLLKAQSTLWVVGSMFTMAVDFDRVNRKGRIIRGSSTGGIADTQECINYCYENNIYADIELITPQKLNDTHHGIITRSIAGYRYVVDMKQL